ncbi:MAG: gamma-glutamylcyclotransferase, partial [Acaryochloridaceae cyanobacterium RL_2_7]|nr:gamma-glutamylcyclotransferase [Acaryochloridaceae cyanobacterium RL_2_7]
MSSLKVFVYGTLKPGYDNHNRYCRDRLLEIQPAQVKGSLFQLPVGYPGMA